MKSPSAAALFEVMSAASKESKLVVTVLGSGTSQGVPMIGCTCAVCRSPDSKDKRTRSSIYLETPCIKLLVDTTPDLRQQCLREGLAHLDAVIFTHAHADHIMGFDDLRRFCQMQDAALPVYGSEQGLGQVERIFFYAFNPNNKVPGYVHVVPHVVAKTFSLGELEITPLQLPHGNHSSNGYLFASGGRKLLAYLSDCAAVPEQVRDTVSGVEVLIIDGLREKPHPTHLNYESAIAASRAIEAGQTFLTHLTHDKSHADLQAILPAKIDVAYDGMKLEFPLT